MTMSDQIREEHTAEDQSSNLTEQDFKDDERTGESIQSGTVILDKKSEQQRTRSKGSNKTALRSQSKKSSSQTKSPALYKSITSAGHKIVGSSAQHDAINYQDNDFESDER